MKRSSNELRDLIQIVLKILTRADSIGEKKPAVSVVNMDIPTIVPGKLTNALRLCVIVPGETGNLVQCRHDVKAMLRDADLNDF